MNDVDGSGRGTGLRAGKSSRNSDANFEYEDSEWDVGIGNLIIDLDADIEKSNEDSSSIGSNTTTTSPARKSTKSKKTSCKSRTDVTTAGNNVNSSSGDKAAAAHRGDKSSKGNSGGNNSPSKKANGNNNNNKSASAAAGSSQGKTTNSGGDPSMHISKSSEGASATSTTTTAASSVVNSSIVSVANSTSSTTSSPSSATTTTTLKSGKGALITQQAPSGTVLTGKLSSSSDSVVGKANSSMNNSIDHSPGTGGIGDKGELKMKIKKLKSGTKNVGGAKHEIVRNDVAAASSGKNSSSSEMKSKGDKSKSDGPDKESNKSISNNDHDSPSVKNDSHSDKNSSKGTNKRGSNTHKKVKGSVPNESTSSSSSSNSKSNSTLASSGTLHNATSSKGKKDESKLGAPAMPNSNSNANSHRKEATGSTIKNSSTSVSFLEKYPGRKSPSPENSPPVKITSGSNNSFSNHNAADQSFNHSSTTTSLRGGFGGSVTAAATGNNSSAFKTTLTSSPGNWASGSPAKNTGGDKGRLSPSAGSASDKANPKTHSPSLGKKARALGSDRSLSQDDSTPHAIASNSGTNAGTSSSYRTSVTLSSASLNDLSTGSTGQGTTMPTTKVPMSSEVAVKTNRVSMPASVTTKQDVCVGTSVGTVTEPDCLGPCEPGTSVTLEGIVWHETESGILVVNVTWRGKTYVGTLMDCTKADWAPPRFCDSPTSDLEMRTPKNRAKRGRGQTATPVNDPAPADSRQGNAKLRNGVKGRRGSSTNSGFATPVSPMKGDSWQKRKTRGSEIEEEVKTAKRAKVLDVKNGAGAKDRQSASPAPTSGENSLIECPEPNCSKKYKHINGLKYHQSHAHSNSTVVLEDSDSNMSSASGTIAEGKAGNNADDNDADIMEVDMVSTTDGENTSSAPTTPAKRSKELSDKVYDINSDLDLKDDTSYPAKMRVLKVTSTSAGKEGDKDGNTRVPILSVPVYSVSAHGRQEDKDGGKGNVIKGAIATTWRPNVNSSASSLAVPVINSSSKDGKSKDQKDRPADSSQSKKNKHKKKSKDKDRERERDSQKGSNGVGEVLGSKSPTQSGLSVKSRDSLDKRSSSLEELRAEKEVQQSSPQLPASGKPTAEVQPMTEVSHADPRSPAYSDISDANDSGPENDLSKKDAVPMSGIADLAAAGKKDGVVGIPPGHGISPFFPSFYSPFIDPNKSGDARDAEVGPDGKPKPKSHLPHHLHLAPTGPTGSPEGRRSPLRESIPGKFPPHYFGPHGPYMGYYDYPPGAAAPPQPFPDGNYASGAHKLDDKDKSKPDKSDSVALITHIKQEPGAEKERGKEEREVHHHHHHHDKPEREGNRLPEKRPLGLLPNQHIIPCNKHAASKDAKRAAAEREREQREREERRNEKNKESESEKERDRHNEGAKPTMETTGPPPPPTAGSYDPRIPYHAYLPGGPFGYVEHPLYRQMNQMMGPPFPGFHPSPAQRFSHPHPHLGGGLIPEDLSRPGGPPGPPKALDVLSQHAAQYYASSHKIHELQERALKSPNPQINSGVVGNLPGAPGSPSGIPERGGRGSIVGGTPGTAPSNVPSSGLKPADLSKDMKPLIVPGHSPESRSPPTQHHVHSHTHHHTHVGIGYPIIPTVPPQYSPHYGVIPSPAPPPAVAASVITPFPPPKST